MPPADVPFWAMVASFTSAFISSLSFVIAAIALATWWRTSACNAMDAATSNARNVLHTYNRYLKVDKDDGLMSEPKVGKAVDDMWAAWNLFDRSYAVAHRYDASLDNEAANRIANILEARPDDSSTLRSEVDGVVKALQRNDFWPWSFICRWRNKKI